MALPCRLAFERDYDTNPTELYLSVQRKDWDGAVERSATCQHEASTWVSWKEADGKLHWRLLPLHAAIIFCAPEPLSWRCCSRSSRVVFKPVLGQPKMHQEETDVMSASSI